MLKAAFLLTVALSVSAAAADVAGKWNATAKDPDGNEIKAALSLKQESGKLTGTMILPEATVQLEDVQFKENVLTCKLQYNGMPVSVKMTLDAGKLKGNYTTDNGETGPIEAERVVEKEAAAASPIAGDWKISTVGPDGGPIKLVLTLKQDDGKWSGQMIVEDFGMTIDLTDIKVTGGNFTCSVPTDNGTYTVEAKVAEEKLEGTSTAPDGTKNKMTGTR